MADRRGRTQNRPVRLIREDAILVESGDLAIWEKITERVAPVGDTASEMQHDLGAATSADAVKGTDYYPLDDTQMQVLQKNNISPRPGPCVNDTENNMPNGDAVEAPSLAATVKDEDLGSRKDSGSSLS
ncbi:uncharacterized protein CPUR_04775 [Claviceps purpurea 20.1]|uniref:Uncharacterized protein n=1 Tax=Claviceps purpurea (strain 20.1) TaxID=1111077 RepID=M1WFG9_CLAP2|nr:uncharacterized protein CPUR_04775 [Claviceps purpurea 20.1]